MARSEARIAIAIWQDQDFLALPVEAQRMYLFLLSQPDLSHCGVIPLRTTWWAKSAAGLTAKAVCDALLILEKTAPPFVIIDKETQELLVRSLIRRDKVLKQPKMIKPLGQALSAVGSKALRGVLATEIRRVVDVQDEDVIHPDLYWTAESMVKHLETPGGYPIRYPKTKNEDRVSDTHRGRGRGRGALTGTPVNVKDDLRLGKCQGITVSTGSPCKLDAGPDGFCPHHDEGNARQAELAEFAAFWEIYPNKTGIDSARKSWMAACARKRNPRAILDAARKFAEDPRRDIRFTPKPANWLDEGRYDDGPPEVDVAAEFPNAWR